MEKIYRKTGLLPLLLAACALFPVTGCEKDTGWTIGPGTRYPYISNTIHGITYEYYLLDENGDKSVVFDQGDTIRFCLYITNNNKDSVRVFTDLDIYNNDTGIFSVYSSEGKLVGKPNSRVLISGRMNWFWPGLTYRRENNWPVDFATDIDFLPSGDYYTTFTKAFDFTGHMEDSDSPYNTGPLTFWIDFRVR